MKRTYSNFIKDKFTRHDARGFHRDKPPNDTLFEWQSKIVNWSLRKGQSCIFADCGLGKTAMQLDWADNIPGRVLIVAPLAVGFQTQHEGEKFGVSAKYLRQDDGQTRIAITNYEMLEKFDPCEFTGLVLDESSILKSYTGKFRNYIIDTWGGVKYRLAATATPAPNDFMELGNHAEFCGVMSRTEMLSMYFVHDGGETQKWRLKKHAVDEFWRWVSSWAIMIRKPSDIGYNDEGYDLPALEIIEHVVEHSKVCDGYLFPMEASGLMERRQSRKDSIPDRCRKAAALVKSEPDRSWLIWCDLNDEADAIKGMIDGAVEIRGSDKIEAKESRMKDFSDGTTLKLITKPSIAGFGVNWQHCDRMIFLGLSDSYEQFYQAIRRCWRFGQKNPVHVHVVTSSREGRVVANIKRKEAEAEQMAMGMVEHMRDSMKIEIESHGRRRAAYKPTQTINVPYFLKDKEAVCA